MSLLLLFAGTGEAGEVVTFPTLHATSLAGVSVARTLAGGSARTVAGGVSRTLRGTGLTRAVTGGTTRTLGQVE